MHDNQPEQVSTDATGDKSQSMKPSAEIKETAILFNISRSYDPQGDAQSLYEATHEAWVLGSNRAKAELAIAVYHDTVQEVYQIDSWYPLPQDPRRMGFNGKLAETALRDQYRGKALTFWKDTRSRHPVHYINIQFWNPGRAARDPGSQPDYS